MTTTLKPKSHVTEVKEAICAMDIDRLDLILLDDLLYNEKSKIDFLSELAGFFEQLKENGASAVLKAYKGNCAGPCEACGFPGFGFYEPISKGYFAFVFEIKDDFVHDITLCRDLKTALKLPEINYRLDMLAPKDISADAHILDNKLRAAWAELNIYKNKPFAYPIIEDWLNRHQLLCEEAAEFEEFALQKDDFLMFYFTYWSIVKALKSMETIHQALQVYKNIWHNEIKLKQWHDTYHSLGKDLFPLDFTFTAFEFRGDEIANFEHELYLRVENFEPVLKFRALFMDMYLKNNEPTEN